MTMHKDKIEELKQVMKQKKEAEDFMKNNVSTSESHDPSEEIQKIKSEFESKLLLAEESLKQAQDQSKENQDKFLRLYAEFENYKKRMSREKEEMGVFIREGVLKELLPVLDDFDRALEHSNQSADIKVLMDGIQMVKKQFSSTLEKLGLQSFDSLGEGFDPHRHEAVAHLDSADHTSNTVMTEYRKGYLLNGKLIRPAMVAVAK